MQLTYSEHGKGSPTLLLLPGWCSTRQVFAPLVPRLAETHRVIAVDLPGHGVSPRPGSDFGFDEIVEATIETIETMSSAIVPVAVAHAGWVAVELRRRLGARVPALLLIDWIVLDPPPQFLGALQALQDRDAWQQVRDALFSMWAGDDDRVRKFLERDMKPFGFEMWSRAAREISGAYAKHGSPLEALSRLAEAPRVCHIYAQPEDEGYLEAQKQFAASHRWYSVVKLTAKTHFPMFEVPEELATAIARCAPAD